MREELEGAWCGQVVSGKVMHALSGHRDFRTYCRVRGVHHQTPASKGSTALKQETSFGIMRKV